MMRSQNPRRRPARTLAVYAVFALLYVGPPLVLAPALRLAGASVGRIPFAWPFTALTTTIASRGHLAPLWRWMGWGAPVDRAAFWAVLAGEGAVLVLGLGAAVRLARSTGAGLPHDSRWARAWDLRRARLLLRRPRALRLILGRLSAPGLGAPFVATAPGVSVLVFGPTGSGKSAGLCVPQILEWDGPVIAVSVKNDLVVQTAGHRQHLGTTDVYDPTGTTGLATCTWSPIARCEDFDRAMRVGQWLVQGQSKVEANAEWAHWEDAAIRLVSTALYAGANLELSITDALSWLDDGSGTKLGMALAAVPGRDVRAMQWYRSVQERPERERGSCYSTSQKALRPYIERAVAASAQDPSFEPREFLLSGNDTLYLVAPQSEQERLSGIFASLVMTVMTDATELAQSREDGRLPRPLLVVLDECANTAPIRELPQYLSTVRSMGISLVAIFQDLSQCEHRYGDLAGSVVNNARAVLFLSGSKDRKTLELLRDLAGRARQRKYTADNHGGSQVSFDKEEMLPLDVGRQLGPGRAILLYEHLSPIALRLRNCYRDLDLRRRRGRHRYLPRVTRIVPGEPDHESARQYGSIVGAAPPQS
ncbi:MAG: type IV secretory system conjugative DNA transfer family protein [Candidatus Dormiibacterota bacterium]